jgi:predicted metal-dependent hydrolase
MTTEQTSLFDDHLYRDSASTVSKSFVNKIKNPNSLDYEVRRSKRRKKSVGAFRENGKTIVVAPIRMSLKEIAIYAEELISKLDNHYEKITSNEVLHQRAKYLVANYLEFDLFETHPVPIEITWVTNQNSRWGSCTPHDGKIRISHRLQAAPQYVIDAVLLHELIHLIVPDHSEKFYAHLSKFEDYKLAKEFLAGYSFARENI